MRILSPYAPDAGYEPGFVELNHEEGRLEITHPSSCVLLEDSQIVPEMLALRCVLHPIPFLNKAPKVQLISEGESLAEAFLYDDASVSQGDAKNCQWSGVALEYVGVGQGIYQGEKFIFSGKTFPFGKMEERTPLYLKPFCVETQSYQVRTTTLTAGHVLTSPPGVLNTRVLRGYGGYYQPGIPLEQIQQVYYALTSDYDQTRIRLYTSSALQTQHTPPPRGGRDFNQEVMFSPLPREEDYLSLTGALAAGYARFSVTTDCGSVPYTSYGCDPVPGHPTFVSVYFRNQ